MAHVMLNGQHRSKGFTLLELLVVVSILAAVSGIGFFYLRSDTLEEKYIDLAKVEMQNIATAVKKFKQDTGYYPGQGPFELLSRDTVNPHNCNADAGDIAASRGGIDPGELREELRADTLGLENDRTVDQWFESPVNMIQLLERPVFCVDHPLAYLSEWDATTGKGWNGPYLSREGFVDTDCTLSADEANNRGYNGGFGVPGDTEDLATTNCAHSIESGTSNVLGNLLNLPAIADPFSSSNEIPTERGGILFWRSRPVVFDESDEDIAKGYELGRIGQPYLLFFNRQFVDNLDDENPVVTDRVVARLVSAGPDGYYDGLVGELSGGSLLVTQEDWCSTPENQDDIVLCF